MRRFPDDLDAADVVRRGADGSAPLGFLAARRDAGDRRALPELVQHARIRPQREPDHPGAIHLYIHATEASAESAARAPYADRLGALVPGAGHLVHMPAHTYIRVGRYHDAASPTRRHRGRQSYMATQWTHAQGVYPLGYVPHNPHFLWFAASMEGASKVAQDAASKTAQRVNLPDLMRQPGFAGLQHYWMTPWFDNVRFGRWDEIRVAPNPAPDLPYVTAIWNYAQAMAAIRQGRLADANTHYNALSKLAADPIMTTLMIWDRYPLAHAAHIAERTVNAELALARGDQAAAIAALTEAVAIEDLIPYDEPPGWHSPVRQSLGATLLVAGQAAEAEKVYREELRRNPQNGWSLKGLALSLRQQQKTEAAVAVEKQLQTAWQHADVQLVASRFERPTALLRRGYLGPLDDVDQAPAGAGCYRRHPRQLLDCVQRSWPAAGPGRLDRSIRSHPRPDRAAPVRRMPSPASWIHPDRRSATFRRDRGGHARSPHGRWSGRRRTGQPGIRHHRSETPCPVCAGAGRGGGLHPPTLRRPPDGRVDH